LWLKDLFDDLESDEKAGGNSEAGHDIPERQSDATSWTMGSGHRHDPFTITTLHSKAIL